MYREDIKVTGCVNTTLGGLDTVWIPHNKCVSYRFPQGWWPYFSPYPCDYSLRVCVVCDREAVLGSEVGESSAEERGCGV